MPEIKTYTRSREFDLASDLYYMMMDMEKETDLENKQMLKEILRKKALELADLLMDGGMRNGVSGEI